MWKLTIKQQAKSEYGNYTTSNEIVLVNESLTYLLTLIERIEKCDSEVITTYKLERVTEVEEKEGAEE